jgi:hypothetical protein
MFLPTVNYVQVLYVYRSIHRARKKTFGTYQSWNRVFEKPGQWVENGEWACRRPTRIKQHGVAIQISVSWPNLTTKIITLWEFLNFVHEVSRLQYGWSSDCWCIWKSLGGKCVSSMNTLWEFLNFVHEVSRLQYEWSSDCSCIWKSLGVNACLQWRNVFSFHWRSVFVHFFVNFSSLSLTAHARFNSKYFYV